MKNFYNTVFKNKHTTILLLIFVVGIFVRTYNFHDWLRFHKDEARDASIISDIVLNGHAMPLLGPVVGTTDFKLGPIFYYFQYMSAKIFGLAPDVLAYPDLLCSILSIPFLYLLLKRFFSKNISLLLVAIYAVDFFAIRYARFAWNPNSQPFFLMLFLYAFLEIVSARTYKFRWFWTAVAGIALGVGVQLHILFLLSMPIVTLIFFFYLKKREKMNWKMLFWIVSIALFLNLPQVFSEIGSGGKNTKEFIKVVFFEPPQFGTPITTLQCLSHVNTYILTSIGEDNYCKSVARNDGKILIDSFTSNMKNISTATVVFVGLLFTLGGYVLLGYFIKREVDIERKIFLQFILIIFVVIFIVCLLVLNPMTMRYFVIIEMVPFIFLGFWLKYILAFKRFWKYLIVSAICLFLFAMSFQSIAAEIEYLNGRATEMPYGVISLTLGEAELFSRFIAEHSDHAKPVYINGRNVSLENVLAALDYLPASAELKISSIKKQQTTDATIFAFGLIANSDLQKNLTEEEKNIYQIKTAASGGRYFIMQLERR
ncbi:MAG: glycosyltransferase family 39 protein [Candidatus Moraniibacteriota bacterium]